MGYTSLAVALLAGGLVAGCASSGKSTPGSAASAGSHYGASPYSASSSSSSSSSSSGQSVALISVKQHGDLGSILAYGPKNLTVYLFEGDKGGKSACSGACAAAWPPVTGSPKAGAGAMSSQLGTSTRSDGTKQVTYNGHPLYLFVKDKNGGDAFGEGLNAFGADWFVLAPSGNKVDKS
jgi:predicted lipoprotein with Yx(FWY)xxD motif